MPTYQTGRTGLSHGNQAAVGSSVDAAVDVLQAVVPLVRKEDPAHLQLREQVLCCSSALARSIDWSRRIA